MSVQEINIKQKIRESVGKQKIVLRKSMREKVWKARVHFTTNSSAMSIHSYTYTKYPTTVQGTQS